MVATPRYWEIKTFPALVELAGWWERVCTAAPCACTFLAHRGFSQYRLLLSFLSLVPTFWWKYLLISSQSSPAHSSEQLSMQDILCWGYRSSEPAQRKYRKRGNPLPFCTVRQWRKHGQQKAASSWDRNSLWHSQSLRKQTACLLAHCPPQCSSFGVQWRILGLRLPQGVNTTLKCSAFQMEQNKIKLMYRKQNLRWIRVSVGDTGFMDDVTIVGKWKLAIGHPMVSDLSSSGSFQWLGWLLPYPATGHHPEPLCCVLQNSESSQDRGMRDPKASGGGQGVRGLRASKVRFDLGWTKRCSSSRQRCRASLVL